MLEWLQKWYRDHCDGEWEHQYGLSIGTLDNPGWSVKIDLSYAELKGLKVPYTLHENSDDDWYGYSVENDVFNGAGDPDKLIKILEVFKELSIKKQSGV